MQVFRSPFSVSDAPCALTIGNFDGVHLGHQVILDRLVKVARQRGLPAAVMTFEPHPRELFTPEAAPARLSSLREKLELLAVQGVDRVYVVRFTRAFAALSADAFIHDILVRRLQARYVLVGDDFCFGARRQGNFEMLSQVGGALGLTVESMPSVMSGQTRVSSTAVREALAAGDCALAACLLGRPYSISGRVFHGDKIGRTLGFPTANIQVKHNKPPLKGIFAVEVHGLDQRIYQGAASLGLRPTITANGRATLEVNLFDFGRSIYGEHLRVDFLTKLRDEEKYASLDELTQAIARDVAQCRHFFAQRELTIAHSIQQAG
ncbi:riboflavin kinase/FMN adenylyltransferase [Chitinivorax tropicus]|uniref:Riboflavin biosynthesis protein n=1 Tax=Chitinivorax tropicus TaxID=714531 RepID=A0A840MC87_9PROT|nr:bifunctional riboflavin kinase/FAD synthetase [Chitinivorax tropicus]MBB5016934.1 riboflavin kinase/FMN adenylyltransferase [Chitinivorax tropicus]